MVPRASSDPSRASLCFAASPFAGLPLRRAITAATRIPEPDALAGVLEGARLPPDVARRSHALAIRLTEALRARPSSAGRAGLVQSLLQEYALSSQEGVALMCLAEALLRIPDAATRDALIRDKIARGQWAAHLGKSASLFVNAATWGLLLTGRLVSTHSEAGLSAAIGRLLGQGGEPLIRKAVDRAMRLMGEQFVTGETIADALDHARAQERLGFRYSYDMLGEAALTARDAERYLHDYEAAILAIGQASAGRGVYEGPGISIKLSALHPRYSRAQYGRVMAELYPVLLRLCALAKRFDIGLNIDAEESDRLELSLDLLERLAVEPQLQAWNGLGVVVQAYQKRCPRIVDHLIDLARRSGRRLMVRLVKGAYWDTEIKRAQVDGLAGYPVYTRKPYTDASYIACARTLLAASDAIYPQFATHNAGTLAAIHELADPARHTPRQYEFQCLHGMGEPLYEQVVGDVDAGGLGRPCRIYAPVGTHETLLAYLVRRLLENGANTSFVNRIADRTLAVEALVRDPVAVIEALARTDGAPGRPHPSIPLPSALYGPTRANSRGLDLASDATLIELAERMASCDAMPRAGPLLAIDTLEVADHEPVINPANVVHVVGEVRDCTLAEVDEAIRQADGAASLWANVAPVERALKLEAAAALMEADTPCLVRLLVQESGKTASNAVGEVREAVDFLRYYAEQVRRDFDTATHRALGPVVCISPWNFPLAIFVGQVAAALAAGNVVLAKPAEQTPLVAARAVRRLWDAGIPRTAVQLTPGRGSVVGARLVSDRRIRGVLFTGSTDVARALQRSLIGRTDEAGRPVPLVAETGGQNAMIVDSSALVEQAVGDILVSAFDSAGQRCSALRVLCVQEDVADRVLDMLLGAMAELQVGDPMRLETDVGPVIDAEAKATLERHIDAMRAKGRTVHQVSAQARDPLRAGTFVLPTLIELDSISELDREVFGPVLHVVRYRREALDGLLGQINATGFGLTMGLHTRIDETIARVVDIARAGNVYVNRNMVGAVVGVQPFGGEGLSGTGPKAGGPLYLHRLLSKRPDDVLCRAFTDGDPSHAPTASSRSNRTLTSFATWAADRFPQVARCADRFAARLPASRTRTLPGPTGERNVYRIAPRAHVMCLASRDEDRLVQLAATLAVGSQAIWPLDAAPLRDALPIDVQAHVAIAGDWLNPSVRFDAVLLHGSLDVLTRVQAQLAERAGPIVTVERLDPGDTAIALERLVIERVVTTNTAAAGGNASLMSIG